MKIKFKAASISLATIAFFTHTAGAEVLASDKWMHIGATASVAAAASYVFENEPNRFWFGVGAGMAVGFNSQGKPVVGLALTVPLN